MWKWQLFISRVGVKWHFCYVEVTWQILAPTFDVQSAYGASQYSPEETVKVWEYNIGNYDNVTIFETLGTPGMSGSSLQQKCFNIVNRFSWHEESEFISSHWRWLTAAMLLATIALFAVQSLFTMLFCSLTPQHCLIRQRSLANSAVIFAIIASHEVPDTKRRVLRVIWPRFTGI